MEGRGGRRSKWDEKLRKYPIKKPCLLGWCGKTGVVWEKSGYGILATDMAILEASISPVASLSTYQLFN
jgi:hypothetical protein